MPLSAAQGTGIPFRHDPPRAAVGFASVVEGAWREGEWLRQWDNVQGKSSDVETGSIVDGKAEKLSVPFKISLGKGKQVSPSTRRVRFNRFSR